MPADKSTERPSTGNLYSLPEISGIRLSRLKEIWDEVKENQRKLDNCATPHRFAAAAYVGGVASCLFCGVCGGRMPLREALIFRRGFAAAGGDPEVVLSEQLLMVLPPYNKEAR